MTTLEDIKFHYENFRNEDSLIVVFDEELEINEDLLKEYFIVKSWICAGTAKKLGFHQQDLLARTIRAFDNIKDVVYVPENNAIVFIYDYLESLDTTQEKLETELDNMKLIIQHTTEFVNG